MKKYFTYLAMLFGCFVLLVICGFAFIDFQMNKEIKVEVGQDLFNIPKGSGLAKVLEDLATKKMIQISPLVFRIYARFTRSKGHVKAGEYSLPQPITHKELLELFRSGRVLQYKITFPEGIRCSEWILKINAVLMNSEKSIDSCENLMTQLAKPDRKAEGQFYPDTYSYTKDDAPLDILQRAHNRMESILSEAWSDRSMNIPFEKPYEALILASVVEKETGAEEDRGSIASVFVNRLKRGMKLQSDPTIIYGLEKFDGNLRRKHLREPSPYNTYVINGLPPTPICNPGKASINAVLNPPETEFLYFVAKGDGRSYFSKSLEEHNKAVRQYQITNRVRNYKSVADDE